MDIRFIDLKAQYRLIEKKIEQNIKDVLTHGQYILGPYVYELEERLSKYVGTKHCITCSSGTDALLIALMAIGIKKNDIVFTTPFTFVATAEVISLLGGIPVFVDIDEKTFNIKVDDLKKAIIAVDKKDPNIYPIPQIIAKSHKKFSKRAIIAVDLFGLCADYHEINKIAQENGLVVIEDGAQSFGAEYFGKKACSLANIGCTSFFPAKPLGCYGDGGAVFVDSDDLANLMRSIRVHGQGKDKYENLRIGLNARLDTIQAAVLLAKMDIFDDELAKRQEVAERYNKMLAQCREVQVPYIPENRLSSWAQYSIIVKRRDHLIKFLKQAKIPTNIYYPIPLHLQKAFNYLGYKEGDLKISEDIAKQIVSLPMHPYLDEKIQKYIVDKVIEFYNQ